LKLAAVFGLHRLLLAWEGGDGQGDVTEEEEAAEEVLFEGGAAE